MYLIQKSDKIFFVPHSRELEKVGAFKIVYIEKTDVSSLK